MWSAAAHRLWWAKPIAVWQRSFICGSPEHLARNCDGNSACSAKCCSTGYPRAKSLLVLDVFGISEDLIKVVDIVLFITFAIFGVSPTLHYFYNHKYNFRIIGNGLLDNSKFTGSYFLIFWESFVFNNFVISILTETNFGWDWTYLNYVHAN